MTEVFGDETACMVRLRPAFRDADMHPHAELTTDEVSELLSEGMGLDVPPELAAEWARRGIVPGVRMRSGRYVWSPQNVIVASCHAESWKRFRPLDPRHLHKLSAVELAEQQAQAVGQSAFDDLDRVDCNSLCVLLEKTNDPAMRNMLSTAFRSKLRLLGVLDK